MKYAASCSHHCQPAYMAASIAFSILSSLSGAQAGNHDQMANEACLSYNRLASAGKTCGSDATTIAANKLAFPSQQIDPRTGQCLASAPATCTAVRNALLADKSFDPRTLKPGAAGFPKKGFTVNPDGSITTADGKTYKASDFDSEKAMIAAGFSAQDAAAAFAATKNSGASKLADSMAEDLKMPALGAFSSDSGGLGTMTIKTTDTPADGGGMGSKDLSGSSGRDLASEEGLVRNFNGDVIGISNDDIFKMMNKRYNLKTAQDTFIGQ